MARTATPPTVEFSLREYIGLMIGVLMVGIGIGVAGQELATLAHNPPVRELSVLERQQPWLRERIPPMTATLRFLPRSQFDAIKKRPDTVAFSEYLESGGFCRLTLPVDASEIEVDPQGEGIVGDAEFTNPTIASKIAHELMHCIRGDWHGGSP